MGQFLRFCSRLSILEQPPRNNKPLTVNCKPNIYMFTYQKTNRYFAQISNGLEELGEEELQRLGASEIKKSYRGLYFQADPTTLYRINYQARLCSRITAPLLRFDCHSTKYLYKTAKKMDWEALLNKNGKFIISATTSNSNIKHSLYAAQCLKDAIADYFREKYDTRPSIDKENPDLWLDLHIDKNKAEISLNTSGESLHRRGYRVGSVEAPMQESLAAAVVEISGWDGTKPLIDPMCGSGTLLSEALLKYCNLPSAYTRKRFGFMAMPDYDKEKWALVKSEAQKKIRDLPAELINGSDISKKAATAARTNLNVFTQGKTVNITKKSFQEIEEIKDSVIICNPPYGIRMKNSGNIGEFIEEFGNFLKRKCTGSTAYLYLGKKELLKKVGLKPSFKKPLMSGGLDGVLAKYELY
jgi:putative N6-adenine-specific DNA methylase